MWAEAVGFLSSWFTTFSLPGLGLAILFGAIWLTGYWPSLFKRYWLWAVLITSAFLTLLTVAFMQLPLQLYIGQVMNQQWSQEILMQWFLLAGLPTILISGLVQEGSKLVPVVVWWWREDRSIDPKVGLVVGAVAGAGFGIFEAYWLLSYVFASGWTWETIGTCGIGTLMPFWERFFTIAFHTAVSALAGYGLAKGLGWQFYLIASGLHALVNYGVIMVQAGVFSAVQAEIFIAMVALLVTLVVVWLRWREEKPVTEETGET
ncbi:PrsW family glutamic-type intramembrane protease [Chloroflexota bacterium]